MHVSISRARIFQFIFFKLWSMHLPICSSIHLWIFPEHIILSSGALFSFGIRGIKCEALDIMGENSRDDHKLRFPFLKVNFYWTVIALHSVVSFCCKQSASAIHIHIHTHTHIHTPPCFWISFPCRSPPSTGFPVLQPMFSLVTYFMQGVDNVYVSVPISQSIPFTLQFRLSWVGRVKWWFRFIPADVWSVWGVWSRQIGEASQAKKQDLHKNRRDGNAFKEEEVECCRL